MQSFDAIICQADERAHAYRQQAATARSVRADAPPTGPRSRIAQAIRTIADAIDPAPALSPEGS